MRLHGAHRSYAWRKYGHIKRLITFPTQIQHVVVIVMENRTVDNLFSAYYNSSFCGTNHGTNCGTALDLYNPVEPSPLPTLTANPLGAAFDPDHHHDDAWMWDILGDWSTPPKGCKTATCPVGATQYSYVPASNTSVYAAMLQDWAFANNVLQANEGPSFVAHQYLIAAQSGGIAGASSSPDAEAENPQTPPATEPTGDFAESDSDIDLIADPPCQMGNPYEDKTVDMSIPAPSPTVTELDNGTPWAPPCEEYGPGPNYDDTILDEMVNRFAVPPIADWQYISHKSNSIWAAPMGVSHLYSCWTSNPQNCPFMIDPDALGFVYNLVSPGPSPTPFAALTYITPCELESDHPYPNPAATPDGPEWLAWVINAIGESKYWDSTAIVVVWDDWGGWFDHEPLSTFPFQPVRPSPNSYGNPHDPNEWGFRVPLFVISPYIAAPGYVSTPSPAIPWRSQSVILQFIEANFGVSTLGGDDEQEGHVDELADMFNLSQSPLPYSPLPEPTAWSSPPPSEVGNCVDGFAQQGPSVRHRHLRYAKRPSGSPAQNPGVQQPLRPFTFPD
jgi:phospholipase C